MSDELVSRLRSDARFLAKSERVTLRDVIAKDVDEAATALTELEQDNAKLREALLHQAEALELRARFLAASDDEDLGEEVESSVAAMNGAAKALRALASQTSGGE